MNFKRLVAVGATALVSIGAVMAAATADAGGGYTHPTTTVPWTTTTHPTYTTTTWATTTTTAPTTTVATTTTTTTAPTTTTTTEVPTSTTTTTTSSSTTTSTTTSSTVPSTTTTTTTPPTTTTTTEVPTSTTTSTTVLPTTTSTESPTSTSTSTSTSTTTTTTIPTLDIAALVPVCLGDAPYIEVLFGNQPQYNGFIATITFTSQVTGGVVATQTAPYQANSAVFFIYPGASVDAAGNPTDWPGWRFETSTQLWVPDPTDDYLRQGLTVTIEVNPTATGSVEYPPATASCANPENLPPGVTTTTVIALPPTE